MALTDHTWWTSLVKAHTGRAPVASLGSVREGMCPKARGTYVRIPCDGGARESSLIDQAFGPSAQVSLLR